MLGHEHVEPTLDILGRRPGSDRERPLKVVGCLSALPGHLGIASHSIMKNKKRKLYIRILQLDSTGPEVRQLEIWLSPCTDSQNSRNGPLARCAHPSRPHEMWARPIAHRSLLQAARLRRPCTRGRGV